MIFSNLISENGHYSQPGVRVRHLSLQSFQVVLFPALGNFLNTQVLSSIWVNTGRNLWGSVSLWTAPPSLLLRPMQCLHPGLYAWLRTSLSSASVFLCCAVAWKLRQCWGSTRAHLICSFFGEYCPLWSDVQCIKKKNIASLFISFGVVAGTLESGPWFSILISGNVSPNITLILSLLSLKPSKYWNS